MGLWLNLERADWRDAGNVKRGAEMSQNNADVPMAVFDALCPVEASVEAAEFEENSARHAARHFRGRR